ncbi:MAG: PAS domain-containing sensor histidine kinase [Spirochaetia bacterium]|jgi:PAS domain S-box-containing protein|nr:PAS domain-containing sensor histidine kinase [Spirochaetia bacterium]
MNSKPADKIEQDSLIDKPANIHSEDLGLSGENASLAKSIFETTGTASLIVNEKSTIINSNQEFAKLSGYTNEEIDGILSWRDFISKEDVKKMTRRQKRRTLDPKSAPRNYGFRFIDRYGDIKDIYGTFNRMPGTRMVMGSFVDITEQKKLESRIIKISEEERRKIGTDLHDGLGPHLVGINFMLSILEKKLVGHGMANEVKDIKEITQLLTQAIKLTRSLVSGLCPVDIDPAGLTVALEELALNTEKIYGIKCAFTHDKSIFMADNAMATNLFLIAQESINNAVKHSKATAIQLTMREEDGMLTMEIEDNGVGLKKLLDNNGSGISIMRYRARLIGASFEIKQNAMYGTTVLCIMDKQEIKPQKMKTDSER